MSSIRTPKGISYLKAPGRSAGGDANSVGELVAAILEDVKSRGDAALIDYSKRFDGVEIEAIEVTAAERAAAVAGLDAQTRADTQFAIDRVTAFAQAQLATILPLDVEALPGVHLGHRVIPIERIGCYVPGGRYPLLSAPVMTIVPAKVAGCEDVIACLPPTAHPAMIAGCHLSGADRIFRIGGAQAIAAMAYGTATIPAVDKIVGPGNAYVNEAKRQVFGAVGIDQLAGPSEIFVVADSTGDAATIATDLLAASRARRANPRGPHHHGPCSGPRDAGRGGAAAPDLVDGERRRRGLGGLWRNRPVRRRGVHAGLLRFHRGGAPSGSHGRCKGDGGEA